MRVFYTRNVYETVGLGFNHSPLSLSSHANPLREAKINKTPIFSSEGFWIVLFRTFRWINRHTEEGGDPFSLSRSHTFTSFSFSLSFSHPFIIIIITPFSTYWSSLNEQSWSILRNRGEEKGRREPWLGNLRPEFLNDFLLIHVYPLPSHHSSTSHLPSLLPLFFPLNPYHGVSYVMSSAI